MSSPVNEEALPSPSNLDDKRKERIVSSLFLFSLTGASILGGFGLTLSRARKKDPTAFEQGLLPGGGVGAGEGLVPGALSGESND